MGTLEMGSICLTSACLLGMSLFLFYNPIPYTSRISFFCMTIIVLCMTFFSFHLPSPALAKAGKSVYNRKKTPAAGSRSGPLRKEPAMKPRAYYQPYQSGLLLAQAFSPSKTPLLRMEHLAPAGLPHQPGDLLRAYRG